MIITSRKKREEERVGKYTEIFSRDFAKQNRSKIKDLKFEMSKASSKYYRRNDFYIGDTKT